MSFEM